MAENNFKYIKGAYKQGEPAHICFYSDVNEWRISDFIYEFKYLLNYVRPSEIYVHINSSGGNCIDGISAFSMIQNSEIPVKTINDGLAASMASIIWAAGSEFYMKDYALLMIHNPFCEDENGDKTVTQATEAFKKQLQTIYKKRFGFDDEKIQSIMDGKDGEDGTWFTAEEAVQAGFLKQENVIETKSGVKDRIAASIANIVRTPKSICAMMQVEVETEKQNQWAMSIIDKEPSNQHNNNTKMTENDIKVVAAQLGFTGDKATGENVSARIKELISIEAKYNSMSDELKTKQGELADAKARIEGFETSVKNLQENYDKAKAKLDQFEKEAAEKAKAEIDSMVEDAIKSGKIEKDKKETWIKQAESNLELTKEILAQIPARENISEQINKDPRNHQAAQEGMQDAEQKVAEKVKAVVGEEFKFRKPNF